jgi:uncharacterized protein GlcG (DUF336 family)
VTLKRPTVALVEIQAAMQAMLEQALRTPDEPVAIAIVDASGNLLAFTTMDNLRLYSRRHAIRKAYTAAILNADTGAHGEELHSRGRSVSEMGDPQLTFAPGGVVLVKDGVILGGIGVGGYASGKRDEELARVGQASMGLAVT